MYFPLANSTGGANQFEVQKENSGGILGAASLYDDGGKFNFKVTYISQSGIESEMSPPFEVEIKPKPMLPPSKRKDRKAIKEAEKQKKA